MKSPHLFVNHDLSFTLSALQICQGTVSDEALQALASRVVSSLIAAKKTVATAESLTGGYIAKTLTDISGASAILEGSVVSYSDRIKHALLGVKTNTLQNDGAVSARTAAEMANGVRSVVGADIGISVTGVAGPTGGTAQTPVGCVFLGYATSDSIAVMHLQCQTNADTRMPQKMPQSVSVLGEVKQEKSRESQQEKEKKTSIMDSRDIIRRQTVQAALQCILQALKE